MSIKTSKSDRTRAFIVERTAEIFNKKGYAGTSMSDLTEVTGLTKGSIYGNFENKEAVALAVFDHNYQRLKGLIDQEVNQASTYHQKLMAHAGVYRRITQGGITRGGCPILNTAVEADDTNEPLKAKAAVAAKTWCKSIAFLISQGVAAGEFKPESAADRTATAIVALIEGGVMLAKVTGDMSGMDQVLETVENLIAQMEA